MLVSKEHQKLVLNLNDPERILAVIPTASAIQHQGHTLVVVPHKLDEVRVLRNLGIDAPLPVRHYYDWPIRQDRTPLEHQIKTVEFLVTNPRAYVLNEMGCVDADTEYLTPTGWKRIADYDGTGAVGQYHPGTGKVEFVMPTEFVKLPCERMVHLKTKYGLDQMLSMEHRVLLVDGLDPQRQEVVLAKDLYARHEAFMKREKAPRDGRIGYSHATIPVTFKAPDRPGLYYTDAQLRVMVACIADGHFPNATPRCVVRLKKPRKIERMRKLLDDAGIKYQELCVNERMGRSDPDFHVFTFPAPWREKEFGGQWWDCCRHQLSVIADEVMHWDGCLRGDSKADEFSSTSRASADFIQYVFSGIGRTARITVNPGGTPNQPKPLYLVTVRKDGSPLHLKSVGSDGSPRRVITEVPCPDGFKYCFIVPSTFLVFRRNGCVFASGNTMKTLSVLWAFDFLRRQGIVKRALITAPLSALERAWGDEIAFNFPDMTFGVLHGTREQRHKLLEHPFDCYIINHDGMKHEQTLELLSARKDIDLVIVDELGEFRNAGTDRYKALERIVKARRWTWGLTGTPTPNEPTDAFAECKLITPNTVPRYFSHFREMVMKPVTPLKWVPREDAMDTVYRVMQPAVRYTRAQCLDLPPTTYVTRTAPLSAEQQKAYTTMLRTLKAEFAQGQIVATNEAVKRGKLLQICTGVAYTENENIVIPARERIELVREIISESPAKVIVFVPLTGALENLAEELRKSFTVEVVHGATPKRQRDRIFADFQNSPSPRVLVANPGTMSHALTLTAANTIVWFAPIDSNNTYEQANARVPRPGQKLDTLIVHIEGSPLERLMYERLRKRQSMQGVLLDMFKGGTK